MLRTRILTCAIILVLLAAMSACQLFSPSQQIEIYNEIPGVTLSNVELVSGGSTVEPMDLSPTTGTLQPGGNGIWYEVPTGDYTLRVTIEGNVQEESLSVEEPSAFVFFAGEERTLDNSHFQGAISYELDGGSTGTVAAGETGTVQLRGFTSMPSSEWQSGSYYDPSIWYTEPTETPPISITVDDGEIPTDLTGISSSVEDVRYDALSDSYRSPFSKATVENQSGREIASIESDGWTYSATIADGDSLDLVLPVEGDSTRHLLTVEFSGGDMFSIRTGSDTYDSVLTSDYDASTSHAYTVPALGTLEITNSSGQILYGFKLGTQNYWVVGDSSRGGALVTIEDGEIASLDGTTVSTMSDGETSSFLVPAGSYGSSVYIDQVGIRPNAGTINIADGATTTVTVTDSNVTVN